MLALIAIIVSIVAVLISFISLWKSFLSPFKLVVAAGELRLRIYPVKNSGKKWYIATMITPLSFANVGAKAGKILSLRLIAWYPDLKEQPARETFLWYGEIDPVQFRQDARHIFKWQQTSVISSDEPFIVLPKSSHSKYMVFKTRWDHPVGARKIIYSLEIFTEGDNKWHNVENWTMPLTPTLWSELTDNLTSIGVKPESVPNKIKELNPKDLHRQIKIKDKIPKGGFQAAPTYVDHPELENEKNITE